MAHLAKDLSSDQRQAIETLLGRPVAETEAVTIRAYEPPALSPQRRTEIITGLESYFAGLDSNRVPLASPEADELFEEAMRQTRPNFRTHRSDSFSIPPSWSARTTPPPASRGNSCSRSSAPGTLS